jgi:hypothetical protein
VTKEQRYLNSIPPQVWSKSDLAKIIRAYNRGEGELGGYISSNVKEVAKLLGIDPYELIENQIELAKQTDPNSDWHADFPVPLDKLEAKKNYPENIKSIINRSSSKQILYGKD